MRTDGGEVEKEEEEEERKKRRNRSRKELLLDSQTVNKLKYGTLLWAALKANFIFNLCP